MRERVVMTDAGFEAVLGTVLVLGWMFGDVDHEDFPAPASDALLLVFGLALFVLALALAEIVKREAVTDPVLRVLAAGNAGFAALVAVWVLVADGFSAVGETVAWATVAGLIVLAAAQTVILAHSRGAPA